MPRPPLSLGTLLAALATVAGCASRPLHPTFPQGSAASSEADAATIPAVTTALEADPPLPGESTAGWPGLESRGEGATSEGHDHAR